MKRLYLLFCVLLPFITFSQGHIIGSFPNMDGGFENQASSGTATTGTLPFTNTRTAYSRNNSFVTATFKGSGGRSGSQYMSVTTSSSGMGFYTPTDALAGNTSYVVQYFFRYNGIFNRSFEVAASPNGGSNFGSNSVGNDNNFISSWTKKTDVIVSANNTATGYGIIRFNASGGGISTVYDFDDIVVYPGTAADVTAPNTPTSAIISNASSTSQNISWTAPSGGVDGGGYVVVRYASDPGATGNDPNQNGIYDLNASVSGAVTGQVVYIGTSTSFVSSSLSPGANYYYKVYAVDKAFNYSNEVITNLATVATKTWDGGAGTSNWGDANNWNPNGVPASSDNVVLDGANTININVAAVAKDLTISDAGLVLTVQSGTSLTLSGALNMSNGTLNIASIGYPTAAAASLTGGTIAYTAATGTQSVAPIPYYNLTLSGGGIKTMPVSAQSVAGNFTVSGTASVTAAGALTVGGDFTIGSGATFNAATFTHNLNGNFSNSGTFTPVTSTINLNAAAVAMGGSTATTTFNNLTVAASSTVTLSSGITNLVVNGTLDIGTGATLDLGTATVLSGTLNTINNNGTIKTSSTSATPLTSGKTWGGTVDFTNTNGGQTVPAGTYNNLTVRPGNGRTTTAGGNLVVNGALYITTAYGAFDMSAYLLSGSLSTINIQGDLKTSSTNATPIPAGRSWNGTVYYNAAAGGQTVVGGIYNCVTFANTSGTNTAAGDVTVTAILRTTAGGTLDMGSSYRLINGGCFLISNNGTIKTSVLSSTSTTPLFANITWGGTGTIEFAATTGTQTVLGATYYNLKLSNTSGNNTMGGDVTVGGALTLSGGTITTGSNTLYLNSTGTLLRTGGHVIGNFKKYVPTGATSVTFEIGNTGNYTPVTVAFASVTTAGDLTAVITASDHPNLTGSGIRTDRSVNRYVTLTNSGIVFTTATLTMNWIAADVDAGSTTSNFRVGQYSSSAWTLPLTASAAATSIQATGLTSFGDFALGELCSLSTAFSYPGSSFCTSSGTVTPTISGSAGTFTSTTGLSINAATGVITLATSTPGTYTITNSISGSGGCSSASTASVTITQGPSATISYAGSSYCATSGTVSVTQQGTTGGTYSSTVGLSINSSTGAVDLGASIAGTYTVTYTVAASGLCLQYTVTTSLQIAPLSNNLLSFISGTNGVICATPGENGTATLTAPAGSVFTTVDFASYGTPGGSCSAFALGTCHAVNSQSVTENYLLGNNSGIIPATNGIFGDPCNGTPKRLYVQATYTQPICSGTSPGVISGTTPTGGNGIYTYLWEKSTTSATAGFVAASGTNNSISYNPGALTQTTWFRRTVTSNGCSVSKVIVVLVTPTPAATISYSGLPFCKSLATSQAVSQSGTPGGTYSSTTGLTIDPATGAIIPSTSTAGTYTVTYTMAAAGGCAAQTATTSVTITALPSATISYSSSTFCMSLAVAQAVTQSGTSGGTYSSTTGLTINATTGAITPSTSTAGTYTVTYTMAAAGGCAAQTAITSVTITALPSATISYSSSTFCMSLAVAQAVTQSGTSGGTYSSTTGLTINPTTGAITPSTSTAGTYTVTYTVAAAGGCAAFTTTTSVTVTAAPSATITYTGSPFCTSGTTVAVSRTGTAGGTYSSTTGLSINASTGDITLSSSTAGTYTVTYTVAAAGGCAAFTTTTSVTITAAPSATISYTGSPFCTSGTTVSVNRTGTAGGSYSSTTGLSINASTGDINLSSSTAGTYTVTYTVAAAGGCAAFTTTTSVTVTAAPSATITYTGSPFCTSGTTVAVSRTGTAGGTYSSTTGLSINASTGDITLSSSTAGTYTVTYTVAAAGGCAAFTTTTSVTITAAPSATISYTGGPFCTSGTTVTVNRTGTAGGTYSSTTGLSINASTGLITLSSSTAGTYTVTYTVAAANGCAAFTTTTSVTVTAAPSVTISYTGSPFCNSGTTVAVSRTGTAGGTYSSTTGLSINASTGDITLSSSTAGTYTVTYSVAAAGGCAAFTTTTSVTITAAPSATISYTGSPFCTSGTTVSVNRTGTAGGSYSSTTGLSINASTGDITLSSSTAGTYTVTYTVAAAGGCAAFTTTTSVTITAAPSATISYAGNPFCTSGTTVTVNRTGTAGGTYSSTTGLSINASTGLITLSSSTAGTYTVTYTVAAASGCAAFTTTTSVTITAAPSATISYTGSPFCTSGTTVAVNRTGTAGGTYSSTTGLSINASTGLISLSSSTAGTYTVTYTVAAASGCAAFTTTTSVTITAAPSATIAYTGSPYSKNGGTASVTFSGTSGGTYSSTTGLSINAATGAINLTASTAGTYTVTYTVAASGGCAVYTTTANITVSLLITKYYVNDNSNTGSVYTAAVGNDANAGTSAAPFLTINRAISVANAGDTVYVDAGTYAEQVNANKAITILGANAAISPNTGTRNAESILNNTTGGSMDISTVNRVVVKGFKVATSASGSLSIFSNTSDSKITLEKNLFDGSRGLSFMAHDSLLVVDNRFTNIVGSTDRTIFVQGDYNGTTGSYMEVYNNTWINSGCGGMNISSSKADIYDNTFSNIAYQGILVANYSSQNITRNVFTNITNPDVSVNTWGAGVRFYTPSAGMITTITNNYFTNNYVGVAIRSTDDVTGRSISINDNSFSGNTYAAINHTGTGLLSANCNWYGSANVSVFLPTILGNVNLSPYLTNGTDNNPGTPGFQPVSGSCNGYFQKWTGVLTSSWDLITNWSGGSVPGSNTDIIIPGGLANYPVINLGTKAVNNVIIQGGGSLTVTGATLQISGSIANSGTFNVSNGSVEMKGSVAQVIPSGAFSGNNVNDLTINNDAGVTLADTVNVINILSINKGALTTGGYLVLKSSAANTARISQITSGVATPIVGNVTVERYIQGRRKYRLITSSVTTSAASTLTAGQEGQSIWGNWQNSGLKVPNMGTTITGGTVADGFDPQTTSASIFTYNTATKKYVAYTSAAGKNTKYTPLKAGFPYYFFVYGDRINSITSSTPNNTVLRATGTVLTGNQVYNTTSAVPISNVNGTYSLIGNPYAAIIDWKKVQLSNVSKTIWGWDPNLSSTGGYVTVTSTLSSVLISPVSDKIKISQYVQPGQAFFVQTTGSNPSLTIREDAKVSDIVNISSTVFRTTQTVQPLLAVNLLYTASGVVNLADGAIAAYDSGFANEVNDEDGKKMANSAEDVSIAEGTELLGIDARQLPQDKDTLFLNIARLTKPQYTLEVFTNGMSGSNVSPFLEDTYLHTVQSLSLTDTNRITFNVVTGVAASAAVDRFRIIFKTVNTLPVTFTSIKAIPKNKDVQVEWNVATETNVQQYEVERSTDGTNFEEVAEVLPKGNNNSAQSYSWLDVNTAAGSNYYRIRSVQLDGKYLYSNIVVVKSAGANSEIRVYPNPIKGKQINVELTSVEKGLYTIQIINAQGQQVLSNKYNHAGGSANETIVLKDKLPAGLYYLKISNEKVTYGKTIFVEQ